MTVLHGVCYSLVPLCINYRAKELQYHGEIGQVLELDFPAVMLAFGGGGVELQPHVRCGRFVGALAGIVFGGVSAFMEHKGRSALWEGVGQLLTR